MDFLSMNSSPFFTEFGNKCNKVYSLIPLCFLSFLHYKRCKYNSIYENYTPFFDSPTATNVVAHSSISKR